MKDEEMSGASSCSVMSEDDCARIYAFFYNSTKSKSDEGIDKLWRELSNHHKDLLFVGNNFAAMFSLLEKEREGCVTGRCDAHVERIVGEKDEAMLNRLRERAKKIKEMRRKKGLPISPPERGE